MELSFATLKAWEEWVASQQPSGTAAGLPTHPPFNPVQCLP